MSKPTVIILSAGANSRFFPLNTASHKGDADLLGHSLLERTLENLAENNFEKVVIVQSAHHPKDAWLNEIIEAKNLPLEIKIVTQTEPKGMGDAVLTAQEHIAGPFAVVASYHYDAGDIIERMIQSNHDNVIYTQYTKQPWLFGIVELNGDKAVGITEKPQRGEEKSNQRILSCYLLGQDFLDVLKNLPTSEYNFETALNELMIQQKVHALGESSANLENSTLSLSLKYPWHLFDFQNRLFSQMESKIDDNTNIAMTAIIDQSAGPVVIEENATIGDFAKIVGPCYIGKNCLVGDYSFVRSSSLEKNVTVGAKTEIVRSIVMTGSSLHFSYVADSIIGPNNKIGANLITANKRLDRANIKTLVKDEEIDTGRRALGIVTGEGTSLGISVNTMPGVLIGGESVIFPGKTLTKNIGHNQTHN